MGIAVGREAGGGNSTSKYPAEKKGWIDANGSEGRSLHRIAPQEDLGITACGDFLNASLY